MIHQISAHFGRSTKESKEFTVVSLREGLADCDSVDDGGILRLFFRESGEGRVEFCIHEDVSFRFDER